jgi:alkylhydroperoxidase family enzyme
MDDDRTRTHLVRMFPDYADSVLWLDGPVDYGESGLSEQLVSDLREWEEAYYASLTRRYEWRSRRHAHAHATTAERLARRVAAELGSRFAVEYDAAEDTDDVRRVTSARPGLNVEAEAAFLARAEEAVRAQERLAALKDEPGDDTGWSAVAPLTGAEYRPRR